MKVAYVATGAGGMYCGSCIHDNALATALRARGVDIILMPIYTPLRTDEPSVTEDRVFFGAINVFMEQKFPLAARLPGFLHRLLDRPGLLRAVTRRAYATDAKELGELTLSMLRGRDGRQRRELDELIDWLRDDFQPDLVHLTNSLLLGMAGPLRQELGVPVVCSVQGEDIFVDDLVEPYRGRVRAALRAHAGAPDLLIATNRYYADYMAEYLAVPASKMAVARLGLTLDGHGGEPLSPESPLVLGYLARICPEKGLHNLLEAFATVRATLGPGAAKLRVAGYLGGRDRGYFDGIERRVAELDLGADFEYVGEVDREQKIDFLRRLHLLSVPTEYHESKGLFVLESLANSVPVVQPSHGSFPELIEQTGGGVLYPAGDNQALAAAILDLWADPARRSAMGAQGRERVVERYSAGRMAEETLAIYRRLLS